MYYIRCRLAYMVVSRSDVKLSVGLSERFDSDRDSRWSPGGGAACIHNWWP